MDPSLTAFVFDVVVDGVGDVVVDVVQEELLGSLGPFSANGSVSNSCVAVDVVVMVLMVLLLMMLLMLFRRNRWGRWCYG